MALILYQNKCFSLIFDSITIFPLFYTIYLSVWLTMFDLRPLWLTMFDLRTPWYFYMTFY